MTIKVAKISSINNTYTEFDSEIGIKCFGLMLLDGTGFYDRKDFAMSSLTDSGTGDKTPNYSITYTDSRNMNNTQLIDVNGISSEGAATWICKIVGLQTSSSKRCVSGYQGTGTNFTHDDRACSLITWGDVS
jgi:hypothetical protein